MSKWISVEDKRKPKFRNQEDGVSETVLLYVPAFRDQPVSMGAFLRHTQKFRPDGSLGFEDKVTHWMPLPKGPSA